MRCYVYVPVTQDRKFLIFELFPETGVLTLRRQVDLNVQPWQLCIDPKQRYLYQQVRGDGYSGVLSFCIDSQTGDVTQIGEVELEADACYVATDRSGRFLLAAYLLSGMVTVHAVGENGALCAGAVDKQLTELYSHCIQTDRSNRFAYVPHVTPTDSIHQFSFDEHTGRLTPGAVPKVATDSGRGPRHLAFHPRLDRLYVNEEHDSSVGVYAVDPESGGLRWLESLSTLPPGRADDKNSTGSLRVHPQGHTLYVSNRGHDSIAVFAVDLATGRLSPLGHAKSDPVPRTLGIAPDGRFFFAGSDTSGRLRTYRVEPGGTLQPLEAYEVGQRVGWVLPVNFD